MLQYTKTVTAYEYVYTDLYVFLVGSLRNVGRRKSPIRKGSVEKRSVSEENRQRRSSRAKRSDVV